MRRWRRLLHFTEVMWLYLLYPQLQQLSVALLQVQYVSHLLLYVSQCVTISSFVILQCCALTPCVDFGGGYMSHHMARLGNIFNAFFTFMPHIIYQIIYFGGIGIFTSKLELVVIFPFYSEISYTGTKRRLINEWKSKKSLLWDRIFILFAFDFLYNYVNIRMKSRSEMVHGLTQSSLKEKQ